MTASDPKRIAKLSQLDILNQLPNEIASASISNKEIVLPRAEALQAIDFIEEVGMLVLGWEGWIRDRKGRIGHGNAPQGTVSLAAYSVREAADICRKTILEDGDAWQAAHGDSGNELYFCITVRE